MKETEKSQKRAREDRALNRVLLWFGGAVVLEFFILLLNRFYVNFDASGTGLAYGLARFLQVMIWVSLVLAVVSVVWLVLRRRGGRSAFGPTVSVAAWTAVCLCAVISTLWRAVGVQALCVLVPAVAVLALVYYLYQREFFLVAVVGGVGLLALWTYRKLIDRRPTAVYGVFAVAAVVTVLFAVGFFLLQRRRGMLPGKKPRRLLAAKAGYAPLYAACGVNAVSLLAALLLGSGGAFVFLFVMVAWLLGAAIYYTVRLL